MAKDKFAQLDEADVAEVTSAAPLKEAAKGNETIDKLVQKIPKAWMDAIEAEEGSRGGSPYIRRAIKRAMKEDGLL